MTVLETERLRLRRLSTDDVDNVFGIFSDPVAMRFSITGVRSRDETAEWVAAILRKYGGTDLGFLAATLKRDGSYVGHAGLLRQEVDGRSETEIAYWFLREHWGRGLATEAAIACRDHGFGTLGERHLVSLIVPENVASRRVAEKVGMRVERETVWRGTRICVYRMSSEDAKER